MVGSSNIVFSTDGVLLDVKSLKGIASIVFSDISALSSEAYISSSAAVTFSTTSMTYGSGYIAAQSDIVFSDDAVGVMAGLLHGDALIEFDVTQSLVVADAFMSSESNVSFTTYGLINRNALAVPYMSNQEYYTYSENWGSYQYVSLYNIVNNFMLMNTGNHSLINNEEKFKIIFHAKRAIQELHYDAFKEVKVLELNVCDTLRFILPHDYVNWVRVSLYKDGTLRPLTENIQANSAKKYLQDNKCGLMFDQNGVVVSAETSNIDFDRLNSMTKSIYLDSSSPYSGNMGYNVGNDWFFDFPIGARFGLNTSTANRNPTFRIDSKSGVINFSSTMLGETCILEYISDGMEGGDDSTISVNKLFEKYIYAYIKYEILKDKLGVQEYIVNRSRKEKTALLRNAKIRISNIHPSKLLMSLRGMDKWIK